MRLRRSDSLHYVSAARVHGVSTQSGTKMSSIFRLKCSAILKAKGKLGSYLPFSIELTVCRETFKIFPMSACEMELRDLSSRSLFFIYTHSL